MLCSSIAGFPVSGPDPAGIVARPPLRRKAVWAECAEWDGESAEFVAHTETRRSRSLSRPGLRSSWSRAFLARINVHDLVWFLPVGSEPITPRVVPGEAGFTP